MYEIYTKVGLIDEATMKTYLLNRLQLRLMFCVFIFLFGCQSSLQQITSEQMNVDDLYLDEEFPTYQSY